MILLILYYIDTIRIALNQESSDRIIFEKNKDREVEVFS